MILILIFHIIGAGILVGGTVLSIYLLSRNKLSSSPLKYIASFGDVMKYAALSQLITGSLLFINEHDKFKSNKVFWVKIMLYVISGLLSGKIIKQKVDSLQSKHNPNGKQIYTLFYIELLILIAIISMGVFLAESD